MMETQNTGWTPERIRMRVQELGDWFHNLDLKGVRTAPNHFLGDYPAFKFATFEHVVPKDLTGLTVLDIGCNAGFYAIEMKKRGAKRVVAIDSDERYLAQARFAAEVEESDIDIRQLDVYRVAELGERFDLVIFMGVLYHLRHPLLALDLLWNHVVGDRMLFQAMQRGPDAIDAVKANYDFSERDVFDGAGFPKAYFVEHRYADDPTNWWIPNRACTEAMLRAAGFAIEQHPEREVYLCRRVDFVDDEARELAALPLPLQVPGR